VVVSGPSYRLGGDIIVEVDGKRVTESGDLREAIAGKRPGDKVEIKAFRGDDERDFEVTLGRQPESSQAQDD
jgi:S1-C subfamily serine protease